MTPEEIKKYAEDQKAALKNVEGKIEKAVSKIQLEDALTEMKTLNKKNYDETLEKLKTQGETIVKLEKQREAQSADTFAQKLSAEIEKNKEQIKNAFDNKSELVIKAVGPMTTGSQSNPAPGIPSIQGVQNYPPSNVNYRTGYIESLVSVQNTTQASLGYTETVPKDGDYEFIGEGVAKPQIDFKIETRYAAPKKVGAHMVLTDESVTDIPRLQSIATDYLKKRHDLKRHKGFLKGDGTGDNPKGAIQYGRAFVAGSMATKVQTPHIVNIIGAAVTDIAITHNYEDEIPYVANFAALNTVDFFTKVSCAKDSQGRDLFPLASIFNSVSFGGVTVLPTEDVDAGKLFVADLSRYNIGNYVPYQVSFGWINDQFITGYFTMVGQSRFHAYVKELDKQAFLYDDIATIEDAIKIP